MNCARRALLQRASIASVLAGLVACSTAVRAGPPSTGCSPTNCRQVDQQTIVREHSEEGQGELLHSSSFGEVTFVEGPSSQVIVRFPNGQSNGLPVEDYIDWATVLPDKRLLLMRAWAMDLYSLVPEVAQASSLELDEGLSRAAVTPDGQSLVLATGSLHSFPGGHVRVYGLGPLQELSALTVYSDVRTITASPDSSRVLIGESSGKVRILDTNQGRFESVYTHHKSPIEQSAWSEDGELFGTLGADGVVRIRSLSSPKWTWATSFHPKCRPRIEVIGSAGEVTVSTSTGRYRCAGPSF